MGQSRLVGGMCWNITNYNLKDVRKWPFRIKSIAACPGEPDNNSINDKRAYCENPIDYPHECPFPIRPPVLQTRVKRDSKIIRISDGSSHNGHKHKHTYLRPTTSSHKHHTHSKTYTHSFYRQNSCDQIEHELMSHFNHMPFYEPNFEEKKNGNPIERIYYRYRVLNKVVYKIPTIIEARFYSPTINNRYSLCTVTRDGFNNNFDLFQRVLGARKTDDKGHILPKVLCGPSHWYNLSPQTRSFGNNLNSNTNEIVIQHFLPKLMKNKCLVLKMRYIMNVDKHYRMKGTKICYDLYDASRGNFVSHEGYTEYLTNDE